VYSGQVHNGVLNTFLIGNGNFMLTLRFLVMDIIHNRI